MIVVSKITLSTLSRDSITLTWTYENTTEDLNAYTATVLRSESQSGPYTVVSQKMLAATTYQYVDAGVTLFSKNREYFYRVKIENSSTGASQEYGSEDPGKVLAGANPKGAFLESPPDLQALEAIRRNDLLLKNFIGRRVLFLKRKTTGTRCTNCWDHMKRRRTRSDCTTCYNTGVTGGFYYPQETFAAKAPESVVTSLTAFFEIQPSDVVFVISSFPRTAPGDLVIADERRFRVLNVRRAEKLWSLTHQTVQLRELTKDQIEYKLAVTGWDKDSFTASPHKQYINATDIGSYYSEIERLGISED